MRAVMLAAGIGKRLFPTTERTPKCLIEIGGQPLLTRALIALEAEGISEAVIVIGHLRETVIDRIGRRIGDLQIRYIENPEFHRGSVLSLWSAREQMEDDLLIMDTDVLFPRRFLSRLIRSPHPNAFLLDETMASHGEEQMLLVRDGRVINSTKHPKPPYDWMGEGVGFFKICKADTPILRRGLEEAVLISPEIEYEDTFGTLLQSVVAGYETVGGLPWIEIDFPEDIRRAEQEILPRLEALERGGDGR